MGMAFERIITVFFENSLRSNVISNPYMNRLRHQGVFLSNSHGVTHPSQPNYIATVGGDTLGITSDTPGYVQWLNTKPVYGAETPPVTSIVDLLEAQGLTWRAYAFDLPPTYKASISADPSSIPKDEGNFARRHVPFLSFPNIISNPKRLANIVDAKQFEIDLADGNLPHYSWYTPNLMNDGHNPTPQEQQKMLEILMPDGPDAPDSDHRSLSILCPLRDLHAFNRRHATGRHNAKRTIQPLQPLALGRGQLWAGHAETQRRNGHALLVSALASTSLMN